MQQISTLTAMKIIMFKLFAIRMFLSEDWMSNPGQATFFRQGKQFDSLMAMQSVKI